MQRLRSSRNFVRFVLTWLALALAAAVASPVIHPVASDLVCSASGLVKLVSSDDLGQAGDTGTALHHTLDCPLCLHLYTPPVPAIALQVAALAPHDAAFPRLPAPPRASRSAAALPPRGPPVRD